MPRSARADAGVLSLLTSQVEATCSRLVTFPVPPSYHRHGSRALILWLGSLPFVLEGLGCHPLQTSRLRVARVATVRVATAHA